tara:strand:- start:299 stop:517 length:219 start_codon:yes stop_codon:yes gene_type:complete
MRNSLFQIFNFSKTRVVSIILNLFIKQKDKSKNEKIFIYQECSSQKLLLFYQFIKFCWLIKAQPFSALLSAE